MFDVKYHNHDFVLQFVTSYKAANGIVEVPGVRKRVSEELLDAFKDMQRNDYNFKAAWEEHVGTKGKRDPRAYPEEEIMKFMTDYANNALPGNIKGKDTAPTLEHSADSGMVGQLKALQRSDSDAKEMWRRYCWEHGEGRGRDPAVHPEAFVKKFLDAYKSNNLKVLKINVQDLGYGKAGGKGKGKGGFGGWWGPY
eukprot:gnl/TRDRNA2_/TRDRNA2_174320_c2_seq10.p1 gnl/TRDRNA2_/TRDRNA2_174320_c2~~gnl/TRDRNA2_/TRDRNA2_174320_c2_seq10.p1  ORF type:complete len:207 (+),score=48.17 gnl/TRDRNA2_/TRDRNA2_174320_c2_seq10:36-623(+)